jgi:TPR repeat protein
MLRRLRRSGGDDARRSSEHAVDAGDRDAMYARGYQYSNETDPPDLDAARGWYERAANAGHVDAMYALGVLYAELMQPPISTRRSVGTSGPPTPETSTPCTTSATCPRR